MNRDGIAEPPYPNVLLAPGGRGLHVWRVELRSAETRSEARKALRVILAAYLDVAPETLEPAPGKFGKPALVGVGVGGAGGAASPSFNLSHSGELALVAVAAPGVEVGVDIERVRPRRDLARLARRWLPEEDAAAIAEAPETGREATFYAAWTRFEARAKCTGAGLSGPPPGPEVAAVGLEIDPGYAAAVAMIGGPPTLVQRFEFSRLDVRDRG